LADGEPPLFERSVADEVKSVVIMRHLEVESVGLKRLSPVEETPTRTPGTTPSRTLSAPPE
jgi:biotin synthase-like enzyme